MHSRQDVSCYFLLNTFTSSPRESHYLKYLDANANYAQMKPTAAQNAMSLFEEIIYLIIYGLRI